MILARASVTETGALIEDVADPTHPRSICSLSGFATPTFISATEVGFAFNHGENNVMESATMIARAGLTDQKLSNVVALTGYVMSLDWSPDGSTLAYLVAVQTPNLGSGQSNQLWIKRGAAAAVALTPLLPVFGRDGSITDQTVVRFSGDGKYLAMIDTFAASGNTVRDLAYFQVRAVQDGSLLFVPAEGLASVGKGPGAATMGVWSPADDTLYYSDSVGLEAWNPQSGSRSVTSGLHWYNPSVSPDGRVIAYTVLDSQQRPHIEVRDLQTGSVRALSAQLRSAALLLSESLLLEYENIQNTTGPGPAYFPGGKVFAIDLTTGTETLMPFSAVTERWPH